MKKEIWKQIGGYEGIYSVSNFGNVRKHFKTKNDIVLKLQKQKNGYVTVNLYKRGKNKTHTVHRLVAKAFIQNPKNKRCVNHIDRNRKNNNLSNLEWCTHKENSVHSFKNGREAWNKGKKSIGISESKRGAKNPMSRKVVHIKTKKIYSTLTMASIDLNIPIGTLSSRLRRDSKINELKYV